VGALARRVPRLVHSIWLILVMVAVGILVVGFAGVPGVVLAGGRRVVARGEPRMARGRATRGIETTSPWRARGTTVAG
jgi:hypothetical protein